MDWFTQIVRRCAIGGALVLAATLAACGGGGTPEVPPVPAKVPLRPPAQSSSEVVPVGQRLDLTGSNYFAGSERDHWDYYLWDVNGTRVGFERIGQGSASTVSAYPAKTEAFIFTFEEYPQPFYSVGGLRVVKRSGTWDEDLDGDGAPEGFHFNFSQVFRGTQSFAIGGTTVTVVHFSQTSSIEITPSDTDYTSATAIARRELWFAPHFNVVKFEEEIIDGKGQVVEPWRQWRISDASVAGVLLSEHLLDAKRVVVQLDHKQLAYDPSRQRYVASLPPSVGGGGLAIVDASTGAIQQTTSLAGEPGPLLVSQAGDALYVGLDATGEVLKLDPDTLTVQARTSIEGARVLGMAISPADPNRLAVSVTDICLGCSGGQVRLVMLDSMRLGAEVSSSPHYSFPVFAFDPAGDRIYSFNNLSTQAELAVHDVVASGIRLNRWLGDHFGGGRNMWVEGSQLMVGGTSYRLPDLSPGWAVPGNVDHCVKAGAGRLLCLDFTRETSEYGLDVNRLVLFDASTGQTLARPSFANIFMKLPEVTMGQAGQLAISVKDNSFDRSYPQIWLYRVAALLP